MSSPATTATGLPVADPAMYRLLADCVRDYAIFLLDPTGHVISWNLGAWLIKQYSESEILGKHFSMFYTAEDRAREWPGQELGQARTEGRFEDEGWRVRKDGTRFWANVIITALRNREGQLLGYAKITRDLTERKNQEESLRRSEERFRLLVDGVQDYAIYMLEPAGIVASWNGGAYRIKGYHSEEIIGQHFSRFYTPEDVAAGKPAVVLAHELRNPLAPIRNAVSVLKMAGETDPTKKNVLDILDRQSDQLKRIVDDLLDISRITRGTLAITKLPTRVSAIVTRAVEAAQPALDAAGHTLTIDLERAPLYIDGDEVRLAQVLTNLLNNAVRYTESGGQIWLSVVSEQQYGSDQVVIRVRDNGRGIASDLIGAIFSMFVQGQDLLNKADSGLGVGLALARSLVELHHGTLDAFSAGPGKGSEFTVRLPLAAVPQ